MPACAQTDKERTAAQTFQEGLGGRLGAMGKRIVPSQWAASQDLVFIVFSTSVSLE